LQKTYSFGNRVVTKWNVVSGTITECDTLSSFKKNLHNHLRHK